MGDSAAQQNQYNQQIRPEKLKEKHEATIEQIEKLQEVERFLFQNLQSIRVVRLMETLKKLKLGKK